MEGKKPDEDKSSSLDEASFLASLADLHLTLRAEDDAADSIDHVSNAPIVTAPGQRPLLDLFPIFFPDEGQPTAQAAERGAGDVDPPLTYEPFFGLAESPFALPPATRFLFRSHAFEVAERRVVDALSRHDRLILVTGEPGVGKTLLCQSIVERLDRRTLASLVADPVVSLEELFEALLMDFGVMSRGALRRGAHTDLSDALRDFLASLARLRTSAVVIVDAAQNLSLEILEGLRALVETTASDDRSQMPLLQLVLVGESELLTLLRESTLQPLLPDLSQMTTLGPLDTDEVSRYVRHRLGVAGNSAVEFEASALSRIAGLTFGVPRLVNMLCDGAMSEAWRASRRTVDVAAVAAAARTLDLEPVQAPRSNLWSGVALVVLFVFLLLFGAALAALVFRNDIAAILQG